MAILAPLLSAPVYAEPPPPPHSWLGLGETTLPFGNDAEILEFLRTAEIVSQTEIPIGVTQSRVLVLEKNGVSARAAFHHHHIVKDKQRMVGGSFITHFRDSYTSQIAAWNVAELLGITGTPPTVLRQVDGVEGSLQLWVENARMESDRQRESLVFPDRIRAWRQVYDMDVFDALINNLDRTQGNFLWDKASWDLWMIDHTRAFGRNRKVLRPVKVRKVSRALLERLRELDAKEVKRSLKPYLNREERRAIVSRRDHILELLEKKIEEKGEDEVLFNHDDPSSVEVVAE